jgi:hypothetical protein
MISILKINLAENRSLLTLLKAVAASLANRVGGKKEHYKNIAQDQWNWFKNSGMINENNTINDGLTGDCKNNNLTTWTCKGPSTCVMDWVVLTLNLQSDNQGVVLGGLVELYKATGDKKLISEASKIANAAITYKSSDGILYEGCEKSGSCGGDGNQFKGIFMRNLGYLYPHASCTDQQTFAKFIIDNADSIWKADREGSKLGVNWKGPYHNATAATQSSALDALVASIVVSGKSSASACSSAYSGT